MANRVLSVDMGYSLTKVCEMDYGTKNPKVYGSFVLKTPEGMLNDGVVTKKDEFITEFQKQITAKGIKTKKIIFSISSSKIATREAEIPFCKKNRIADLIRANLSDYFPIDSSQYLISHSILATTMDSSAEAGADKKNAQTPTGYKLLLLAAPKKLIESYGELAKALGMEMEATDYSGNSLYQAVKQDCSAGVEMIIRVDERGSLLLIIKNGVIIMNRTIPYGMDDAVTALMETKELGDCSDYASALLLARRKTCVLSAMVEENETENNDDKNAANYEAVRRDKKLVTESFKPFISGVERVIDYYNSNHAKEPIEKMYVTGVGADFSGLSTLLTNEIGFKIKNLTKLTGVNLEKSFKEVSFGEYITCMGAAIEPLQFYSDHVEAGKEKGKGSVNYQTISFGVLIGCGAIGLILIISSLVPFVIEKNKKKNYENTISELQPAYDTYLKYQAVQTMSKQLDSLDQMTVNRNDDILTLIDTLEKNMPTSFRLNNLTVTPELVTLDVTVGSKEEVAVVLSELSKLTEFAAANVPSVTEVENEIGEKQYNFSAELLYAPITTEEEEVNE